MAGRRGNNEGSILKRPDGRWEARISLPNGKRKSYYGKTREEVSRKLVKVLHEKEQGFLPADGRQPLSQFLEYWLEVKGLTAAESTIIRYKAHLRHLINSMGKISLAKLTPQALQAFYAKAVNEGLSSGEVHDIHAILHGALEHAIDLGLVNANVTDRVKSPRKPRHEMATLTEAQVRSLLDLVRDDRLEALYVLVVTTGMREGELLSLHWKDVDLEKGTLQVRYNLRQVPSVKGRYVIAETKTAYSRRSIALSKAAIEALKRRRELYEDEMRTMGAAWKDLDLVFTREDGNWIWPMTLRRNRFYRLLAKGNLPKVRFHDLRHTAATLLLSHGVNPKVVSEMLGHSSVSITLDIYSHVIPHMQQAAADVMDAIVRIRL